MGVGGRGQPGPRGARSHSCDVHLSHVSYIPAPDVLVIRADPAHKARLSLQQSSVIETTTEMDRILTIVLDGGFHPRAPERSEIENG